MINNKRKKKNNRAANGGNFKCPTISGESAVNNMIGCKMAALSNETSNLNSETQQGFRCYKEKPDPTIIFLLFSLLIGAISISMVSSSSFWRRMRKLLYDCSKNWR